ncbi:unnamed protein product (macronuclear) [Paramecium tetraurelia]|uniref:EF-hand domain-containing protein n=1 Tax=Paramecium tetraurelia TaxID=5888 RepID=A0CIN3_PARTE|nr:uncharacterized protein GSPATT00007785001 [Paramecium tetraurelia]CAK70650.1 unnamed protein product [Paramecium tetraurelia]|eukprot:XP_001438047.1 hypothetical protein (macronuclear) [Paramecium tetraurelia strain d4-2]
MARLIGNANIKLRNPLLKLCQPTTSLSKLIALKLIFIDDVSNHYTINCKKVNCFYTQGKQIKIEKLIEKELNQYSDSNQLKNPKFYFYDLNGNQITMYDPSIETYLVSIKDNNHWLYDKKYEKLLFQIIQMDTSIISNNNISDDKSRKPSLMNSNQHIIQNSLYDHLIPQSSFRSRILQKGIQHLENVYDNFKMTSRQNSDPFIITNCKFKTTHQSFSSQNRPLNISYVKINTPNSTPRHYLTDQEQYFINNMQKCQDDLDNFINKLKSNLSKENEEVEKIIRFYENVLYPTPKSRALEMKQISTSSLISTKLTKILGKQFPADTKAPKAYVPQEKKMLYKIPPLLHLNIPSLQAKYRLNRSQLYAFFSLYKVLHLISGYMKIKSKQLQVQGITYEVYRNGIETIQDQAENMARGIFDIIDSRCSGFLDWSQFLYLMSSVQAKTRDQRIDLFIKIADSNKDGQLSYQEVVRLSQQTLQKFIKNGNTEFLDEMSQFFTKVIFDSVGVDYQQEIQFNQLKEVINQGHPNSDLLCMFCGADS